MSAYQEPVLQGEQFGKISESDYVYVVFDAVLIKTHWGRYYSYSDGQTAWATKDT